MHPAKLYRSALFYYKIAWRKIHLWSGNTADGNSYRFFGCIFFLITDRGRWGAQGTSGWENETEPNQRWHIHSSYLHDRNRGFPLHAKIASLSLAPIPVNSYPQARAFRLLTEHTWSLPMSCLQHLIVCDYCIGMGRKAELQFSWVKTQEPTTLLTPQLWVARLGFKASLSHNACKLFRAWEGTNKSDVYFSFLCQGLTNVQPGDGGV